MAYSVLTDANYSSTRANAFLKNIGQLVISEAQKHDLDLASEGHLNQLQRVISKAVGEAATGAFGNGKVFSAQ